MITTTDSVNGVTNEISPLKQTTKQINWMNRKQSETISLEIATLIGKPIATSKTTSTSIDLDFGSVELDKVLGITDEAGITNYTYTVIPKNPAPNKFYNLVYTKKGTIKKIKVLEYTMTEAFKDAYYKGQQSINQFKGTISEVNITSLTGKNQNLVPCPKIEVTLPGTTELPLQPVNTSVYDGTTNSSFSGGSALTYSSGSSTVSGPGSGTTGSTGSISTEPCGWKVVVVLCTGENHHSPGENCPLIGSPDAPASYLWNSCNGQTIKLYKSSGTKATKEEILCDDGVTGIIAPSDAEILKTELLLNGEQWRYIRGETITATSLRNYYFLNDSSNPETKAFVKETIDKMRLNPDVYTAVAPLLIEESINDTNLDPCPKGVFQQVKNTTVCDIAEILKKLGATKSVYNTTIKSEVPPNMQPGQTIPTSKYNYTIYISTDYPGKTKLFIAGSMMHELAHAYFLSIVDDYKSNPNNNQNLYNLNSFPSLFQAYCDKKYPPASGTAQDFHHQEMANYYVDAIARSLQEFQTGIPVVIGASPEQIYSDLAWGGLNGTPVFDATYPIGNPNRQRIINRYACEQNGTPIGAGTPNEQTPISNPCN